MKAKLCGGSCLAENKLSVCFSANLPGRVRYLATNIFVLTGNEIHKRDLSRTRQKY